MRGSCVRLSREISGLHPGAGLEGGKRGRLRTDSAAAGSVSTRDNHSQRKPHVRLKNERWNKFPVLIFTAIMITIRRQTSENELHFSIDSDDGKAGCLNVNYLCRLHSQFDRIFEAEMYFEDKNRLCPRVRLKKTQFALVKWDKKIGIKSGQIS